jgi:hypothetical protein
LNLKKIYRYIFNLKQNQLLNQDYGPADGVDLVRPYEERQQDIQYTYMAALQDDSEN